MPDTGYMEAITDTAIINAADYRPEADQAQRSIVFDPDQFAAACAFVGMVGTPFVKVRVKGPRQFRPLAYTEHLEQGYRVCLTAPPTMTDEGLQAVLNTALLGELGLIAGMDTMPFTDAFKIVTVVPAA